MRAGGLPPLASLRAFEAVGRLASFSRAGEELLITQSAVSHHIKQLERHVQTPLFRREGRRISLTAAGAALHAKVTAAFELLGEGIAELRAAPHRLRVSTLPSFAARWLLPRLHDFRARHPEIEIDVDATLKTADINGGEADIGIRYGAGSWPDAKAERLMAETLTPVLSPARLGRGPPLRTPADILQHMLLLTAKSLDWDVWLQQHGLQLNQGRSMQLVDYNVAISAAVEGQGVALGRLTLIRPEIDSGALVAPLARVCAPDRAAYWIITPSSRASSPAARLFRDWLVEQAMPERQDPA